MNLDDLVIAEPAERGLEEITNLKFRDGSHVVASYPFEKFAADLHRCLKEDCIKL